MFVEIYAVLNDRTMAYMIIIPLHFYSPEPLCKEIATNNPGTKELLFQRSKATDKKVDNVPCIKLF